MNRSPQLLRFPVLITFAVVNFLLPFVWSWMATRYGLSVNVTGMATAIHEFLTSLISFFLIRALIVGNQRSWLNPLQWALLSVAVADLSYGITAYIVRIPPPRGLFPLVHEVPYVLFSVFSAYAVIQRALQNLSSKGRKWALLPLVLVTGFYFLASYELILLHFFQASPARPFLIYATATIYALGQAAFVGGLLIASVRTIGFIEFLLWTLFLGMSASDFVLRYQDIGGPISGLSFFEYGWELAFAGVTAVLVFEWARPPQNRKLHLAPAPLHSLRVITATVTLLSLLLFAIATSWLLSFLKVATAHNAGGYALIFAMIWSASNAFSIAISQGLRKIHERLLTHSVIRDNEMPPMAWEVAEIFAFLHGRNVELLKERDKALEEAHRLKTESVIYGMAHKIMHDVKAPISTLSIMLETELRDLPVRTKDKIRHLVGRIRAIIDTRLKQYSEDAIAETRQPEERNRQVEAASVGGAVQWIFEEEEPKARARGVAIICDLPRFMLRAFAGGSFSDLCRIFSNLLVNAIDAAEQGGHKVFITAQASGTTCEVVIRDSGRGFDPETLKRVLANEKATTKANGSGLGLVTVRSLIAQAKGEFQIQSLPTGTITRIRLPLQDTPQWFFDISRTSSDTVVALDDDSSIRHRLESLFPDRNVHVLGTEEEFLKAVRAADHPLLLVDYDYGGLRTGIDFIVSEGLTRNAVLLSGRLTLDHKVRTNALEQGVRLFPKECLG